MLKIFPPELQRGTFPDTDLEDAQRGGAKRAENRLIDRKVVSPLVAAGDCRPMIKERIGREILGGHAPPSAWPLNLALIGGIEPSHIAQGGDAGVCCHGRGSRRRRG